VLITAGAEQSVAIGLMAAELATSGKGALHNITIHLRENFISLRRCIKLVNFGFIKTNHEIIAKH
jgi:hypothetical protein